MKLRLVAKWRLSDPIFIATSVETTVLGVNGVTLLCDNNGCVATAGDAGQFVAGAGGILLHRFLSNFNGPGGWAEKFVRRFVQLRGVTYEYTNPAPFGELPGTHLGMIADNDAGLGGVNCLGLNNLGKGVKCALIQGEGRARSATAVR